MNLALITYINLYFIKKYKNTKRFYPEIHNGYRRMISPYGKNEKDVKLDEDHLEDLGIKDSINTFINNLEDIGFDTNPFINRINKLKIKKIPLHVSLAKRIIDKQRVNAYYDEFDNSIRYKEGYYIKTLPHELFHLSSYKDYDHIGFQVQKFGLLFGRGLNEGYTQALAERYFELEQYYPYEVNHALYIESIIGEDKMMKFYNNADLKGLINELCKYGTKEEVIRLIYNIDYSLFHLSDVLESVKNKDYCFTNFKNITNTCIKLYLNKFKENYKIDKEEAIEELRDFISNIYYFTINDEDVFLNDFDEIGNSLDKEYPGEDIKSYVL